LLGGDGGVEGMASERSAYNASATFCIA